ncbi:hypothetical protein [Fluviicola taffensis]|uniref:Secreted protein n=1 Tax=Fluviicola taffensis (strain DSM 16823 / NCIMB 13979 / RW262) TaxID=755732 RepID=F2I975_FLUTR|nr:hypothetical protein [Fluviicola taffensis]AEA43022.1 hypothetical protein Fluta_1024 [Fluviicola taffensis DSM 16823]
MINKSNLILLVLMLGASFGYTQIASTESLDSTMIKIDNDLHGRFTYTSIKTVYISDSIIRDFFFRNSELYLELSKREKKIDLPRISISTLDTMVVMMCYNYSNFIREEVGSYHFINEELVKAQHQRSELNTPRAMSDCIGWAISSSVTYYKNNTFYKTVNTTSDRCGSPVFFIENGLMAELIRLLPKFKLFVIK